MYTRVQSVYWTPPRTRSFALREHGARQPGHSDLEKNRKKHKHKRTTRLRRDALRKHEMQEVGAGAVPAEERGAR